MMQRTSFKYLVSLALLVMSISLVPITNAQVFQGNDNPQAAQDNDRNKKNPSQNGQPTPEIQPEKKSEDKDLEGTNPELSLDTLQAEINELKRSLERENDSDADKQSWFLKLEIIISAIALLVSSLTAFLFVKLINYLDKSIERIKEDLKFYKSKLDCVEINNELLETLKTDVQSVQKNQDVFKAASALKNQSSPFQTPPPQTPPSSPPFPSAMATNAPEKRQPSLTVAGLIRAINTGDRQVLRETTTAELNITSASENTIAMGMSEATELEEVSAGGSYLLASLEGRTLLFPTDRTLRGFSTTQPSKGLYSYEQQSVAKAEIIEPAVLEKSGAVWRVSQKGRVAIP